MSESGEVLKEALQTARSEADILDALARRVEFVDGGEGEPEIPTVEALAGWLPMSARVPGGGYTWEPTLEEIRNLLWPKSPRTGKSSWKPSKHWRALYQALDAVNLAKVELPNRELWLPVRTWRQPDPRNLDSRALIEIALPPGGGGGGPQLDRAWWIADGTHSDPAFDLRLSLAWLWEVLSAGRDRWNRVAGRIESLIQQARTRSRVWDPFPP